jgi:hypothetical protein
VEVEGPQASESPEEYHKDQEKAYLITLMICSKLTVEGQSNMTRQSNKWNDVN